MYGINTNKTANLYSLNFILQIFIVPCHVDVAIYQNIAVRTHLLIITWFSRGLAGWGGGMRHVFHAMKILSKVLIAWFLTSQKGEWVSVWARPHIVSIVFVTTKFLFYSTFPVPFSIGLWSRRKFIKTEGQSRIIPTQLT